MSDTEGEKRPRMYFTEFLSILSILDVVIRTVIFGFFVLVCSEIYFYFSSDPKPGWVEVLETVYGKIWTGVKIVGSTAFGGKTQTAQPDATCAVVFIQFKDGTESGRWTYAVKDLTGRPEQETSNGTTWQKVELLTEPAKGATGWVVKADYDTKRAIPGCAATQRG